MGLFSRLFRKKSRQDDQTPSLQFVSLKDSLGNVYKVRDTGSGIVDESVLTDETQSQLSIAEKGLGNLLQEMATSQEQRQAFLTQRQKELYTPLASEIGSLLNQESSTLRSREAKRFGGALNSTFSANALGSLVDSRTRALESAYSGSFTNALKELLDLDQSRSIRFNTLANFLEDAESRKQRYTLAGFDAIQQSRLSRQQALQSLTQKQSSSKNKTGLNLSADDLEKIASTLGNFQ